MPQRNASPRHGLCRLHLNFRALRLPISGLALVALAAASASCVDDPETELTPSFEEFRETHALPEVPGLYVIDHDLVGSEDDLYEYYQAQFEPEGLSQRSIVHHPDGDARNAVNDKIDLTYCVSEDFGGSQQRLTEMMETATSEWELYGDVNFVHRPEYDNDCDRKEISVEEVSFTIERSSYAGANGFAFFPDSLNSYRRMWITDVGLEQSDPDLQRTVRHELGHILGFRHEHMFTCNQGAEGGTGRSLTPTDDASIMWTHAVCNNSLPGSPGVLSRYDALGISYMYNLPTLGLDLNVLGGEYKLRTDYNSDGATDVRLIHMGNAVLDYTLMGGQGGLKGVVGGPGGYASGLRPFPGRFGDTYGVSADIMHHNHDLALDSIRHSVGPDLEFKVEQANLDGYHVPFAGDFDGNGYTDIFWYGPGSDSDEVWYFDGKDYTVNKQIDINLYALPVVGDYNGDGKEDIFWYDPQGTYSYTWIAVGQGGFEATPVQNSVVGLERTGVPYLPMPGDFNNDGHDDIFWYRPGVDSDQIWFGAAFPYGTRIQESVDGHYRPIVDDFDGNGSTDIFWYGQGKKYDSIWYFDKEGGGYKVVPTEVNGDYAPFTGDFDADGDADILWYRTHDQESPVWYSDNQEFKAEATFVPAGYYPIGYGPSH